ncbi:MAG: hypothetical protein ACKVIQ_10525 [Acidimicrobiales bacterium]
MPLLRHRRHAGAKLALNASVSTAAASLSPSESSLSTAAAASSSSGFALSLLLVASIVGLLAVLGVVGFLAFGNAESTDVAGSGIDPAANDVTANARSQGPRSEQCDRGSRSRTSSRYRS